MILRSRPPVVLDDRQRNQRAGPLSLGHPAGRAGTCPFLLGLDI